jgi:hypothetical protein
MTIRAAVVYWLGIFFTILTFAILLGLLSPKAHADPGIPDICGTGKFYNQYDNSCVPTDRGAEPNYPQQPGFGGGYGPRGYY